MSNIYLGVDIGSKTLGLAIGHRGFAFATTTLHFQDRDFVNASQQLMVYIKKEHITHLIFGYPKRLNNHKSSTTVMIEEFISMMKRMLQDEQYNIPIDLWDERLTSKMATEILRTTHVKSHHQARNNHQLAAQLILQNFLDYHANITTLSQNR